MIIPRRDRKSAQRAKRRAGTATPIAVESLEGRQLLSHGGHVLLKAAGVASQLGLPTGTPGSVLYNHPGPILNEIGSGFAVKVPRFYPFYTGPLRAELNGAASIGLVTNGGTTLQLNGEVAGQIIAAPTSPAQEANYVFGINRGGATGTGPFPGRPGILFDAVVIVRVRQSGVNAYVVDLNSNAAPKVIDPANIQLIKDTVKVTVPLALLPATGPGGVSQYKVNFWASDPSTTGTNGASVASFTPEFRSYRVHISPR